MRPSPRNSVVREVAAAAVVLAGAAAWFQPEISVDDLWWLLAAGRQIVEGGSIPSVDAFSFTFAGRPWMNHEWLWSTLYWLIYSAGPDLVAWFNLAVLAAVFGLFYATARAEGGSPLAAGLAVGAAAATSHWFLDIRPHLFTLGFVGLVLWTRRRAWAPWLWPALMLVWVNVHGGFVFGLGVMGLVALLPDRESRSSPRARWAGFAVALGASLVNPWGWHIVEYPLAYLEHASVFRGISEWLPPGLALDPTTFNGRFTWLVVLSGPGVLLVARSARPLAVLWIVTCAMAFTSRRFIPLFALVAAPLLAVVLGWLLVRLRARSPWWDGATARVGTLAVALCIVLLLWRDVRFTPRPLDRWTLDTLQPQAGLDYLERLGARRPFHDLNWGGFILLHAPEIAVFIDGRANTLYDSAIAQDYLVLEQAGAGYESVLERWGVDSVFVETRHPLVRALRRSSAPWKLVYRDALCAILLPGDSPLLQRSLPEPDADAPAVLDLESQRLLRLGRSDQARAAAERAVQRDPLFVFSYREWALACAAAGDAGGMQTAIAAGIAAYPQGIRRFRAFEGIAWEQLGEPSRALRAYRAARPRGPFEQDPAVEARLAVLDEPLNLLC